MFLAHISEDRARQQSISDHLYQTARLAGDFAASFEMKEWGYGFGLYHDIGKYSLKFQNRLQGGPMTDHATAGAQELFRLRNIAGYAAAYCISGHHSGLLDGGGRADVGGEATLMGRMNKRMEPYQDFRAEIEEPRFTAPPIRPMGKGDHTPFSGRKGGMGNGAFCPGHASGPLPARRCGRISSVFLEVGG